MGSCGTAWAIDLQRCRAAGAAGYPPDGLSRSCLHVAMIPKATSDTTRAVIIAGVAQECASEGQPQRAHVARSGMRVQARGAWEVYVAYALGNGAGRRSTSGLSVRPSLYPKVVVGPGATDLHRQRWSLAVDGDQPRCVRHRSAAAAACLAERIRASHNVHVGLSQQPGG